MKPRTRTLKVEQLETREVPAAFVWIGGRNSNALDAFVSSPIANGNWQDTQGNWVNRVPTTGDTITINQNQVRTMYIPAGQTIDCDRLTSLAAPNPAGLTHDTGDPAVGTVFVRGTLNIHGVKLPATNQSVWSTGTLEIDSTGNPSDGIVNLDGGRFSYTGGEIDTINNDGGRFYVYNGGELKLTAGAGKIGATLNIGITSNGLQGPATLTFAPSEGGNIWFYKDAKIWICPQGTANLSQGGIKLWNFGGPGAATGFFANVGGTVSVNGDVASEMFFDNEQSGTITVNAWKKLKITGFTTLADQSKASFVNQLSAKTTMKPGAILEVAEGYYQTSGQFVCDEAGNANASFTVTGNMQFVGGTLQMGVTTDEFGTLNISGSLTLANATLKLHSSGPNNKVDKINAQTVALGDNCTLNVHTTGAVSFGTEREFLTGTLTGDWDTIEMNAPYSLTVDAGQKKILYLADSGGGL